MEDCTKRKFASMADAQAALDRIADDPEYGPRPRFAYPCNRCGWIHLTKQDPNSRRRRADRLLFEQQNRIILEAQYWLHKLSYKRKR